jgi:DNA-directed RNA polymerase specialized sigma24 family protein
MSVKSTLSDTHEAYRKTPTLEGIPFRPDCELRPWLTTIAFNLAREQLRRARRRPEAELDTAAEIKHARQPEE